MFIIAYLRVWRVSTLSNVCMWTSRWLFIVRFLFHLILGISHVVVILADVRSSSSIWCSKSTNTRSFCVCKQKTSCTLSKSWLCCSDRRLCRSCSRLWRQACDQVSNLGVELGVDHLLHTINRLCKSALNIMPLFSHHLCKFIMKLLFCHVLPIGRLLRHEILRS